MTRKPTSGASAVAATPPKYPRGSQDKITSVVKPASMKPLPPERPGADNDLKDLLEGAALKAMKEAGTLLYALGARWGPEKNRPDQYFRFAPGNGVHDIHMNQGSAGAYRKDNGVYQDGALFLEFPGGRWRGIFLAFPLYLHWDGGSAGSVALSWPDVSPASEAFALANTDSGLSIDMIASAMPAGVRAPMSSPTGPNRRPASRRASSPSSASSRARRSSNACGSTIRGRVRAARCR